MSALQRVVFFFNDTATTEIYTLSLHDALPISPVVDAGAAERVRADAHAGVPDRVEVEHRRQVVDVVAEEVVRLRSEEHTSELQSRQYLVCRLLLEKKKNIKKIH